MARALAYDNTINSARGRRDFRAPLFRTVTGNTEVSALSWLQEVEVKEWGDQRSRVAAPGVEGYVDNALLAEVAYIGATGRRRRDYTAKLYGASSGDKAHGELLWGDRVFVVKRGRSRSKVRARGRGGWVSNRHLDGEPLLECYFIDVGQGDGVLVCTPGRRHLLVDGGYLRTRQPTGKSAADFIDWKFFDDYRDYRVRLDAVVSSHCDADHYGGLWDLVRPSDRARRHLDTEGTEIGAFYHAGVSWWRPTAQEKADGEVSKSTSRWLGPSENDRLVRLIDGEASIRHHLEFVPELQGDWAGFLGDMIDVAGHVGRLGFNGTGGLPTLPEFGTDGEVTVSVLAPIVSDRGGAPTVEDLGSYSQNTNGHSALLRVDYKDARILLTGDLNKNSIRAA